MNWRRYAPHIVIAFVVGLILGMLLLNAVYSTAAQAATPDRISGVATHGVKVPDPRRVPSPGAVDSDRNLRIRGLLIRYWNAELNGTVPYPEAESFRTYRRLQARYFIWAHYVYEYEDAGYASGGGWVWSAARYTTHRYRVGNIVYRVRPPRPFTIGPVEWNLDYRAWEPGLGQPTPWWYR